MSITRTDTNGNTTTYADKSALQSFNRTYNSTHASVGGSVPLRNDLQANGGAGYNTLSRMSTSGSINPDSVQAGSAGTPGSLSLPTSNVVNSLTLKPTTGLNLPTKQDTIIPSVQPATSLEQQKTDAESQSATDFQKYLDALTAPPSSADSYRKAQKETGILQKQDAVNNLTSQLNQIVAQGQASQLQVVGQGRGIPEAIIGGQQAQIARETAIQALPVSAQLAAAQGNLDLATQNMNTLFKIYSDDATNRYTYKTKINEAVYNYASKTNQSKIDDIQKKLDREYTEKQANLKANNEMIINAFSQGASNAITSKALDVVSKGGSQIDVAKALGVYSGDYLGNEAKKASIASSKASAASSYASAVNSRASAAKTRAETAALGTPGTPGSGKPPTDIQIQNAGYADRIKQANDIIDSKASVFKKMGYVDFKLVSSTSQIANKLASPDVRQAAQAMRNFITAKLRKESGAAIAQSEFDDARVQYFPSLGDDATTLTQKKSLRDSVLNNLITGSGSAYTTQAVNDNPFKSTLLNTGSVFNSAKGWIIPTQ